MKVHELIEALQDLPPGMQHAEVEIDSDSLTKHRPLREVVWFHDNKNGGYVVGLETQEAK